MTTKKRQLNTLEPLIIKNLKYDDPENPHNGVKAQNTYPDGGGMYLQVMANGSKYWRLDYTRPNKKRNTFAIGVYEKSTGEIGLSLSNARKKRDEARELLKAGIDPADDRDQKKYDLLEKHANTFEVVAAEVLALRKLAGKNDYEFNRRLNADILPYIGKKPVTHLTTNMLEREVFQRIYDRNALPLAKKVKGDIKRVLERARKHHKLIPDNPATDIEVPDPVEGNYPALIDPKEITQLVKDMWSYDQRRGVSLATTPALKLSIMTFLRPGELRSLKWSSFKREEKILMIQSLKRDSKPNKKQGNQPKENHIVPLSRQAIEILEWLYQFTGNSEYVFFSPTGSEPYLSEGTVNGALIRLGYKGEQTAHGLRATARTMIDERLKDFRPDWIEHQLAHTVKDTNGTAYNRTKHLDDRFKMMQAWSDYLDELRTGVAIQTPE